MATEFIRQLLEAGVHFGHQTKRWNPKMQKFIFGERNGIYIIDLEKTAVALEEARRFLKEITSKGGNVLFVGTKKQAQEAIVTEAQRAGAFYIGQRWVGGLLTNFQTVKKSIKRLKDLEKMREEGVMAKLSKKEAASLIKEINKLKKNFSGIMNMEQLPEAIFIIDPKKEETAIQEARRLNVPIVALIDTNSDPDLVDFPIPGNDDAIKSIRLIINLVADSVLEGRQEFLHTKKAAEAQTLSVSEEAVLVPETSHIEALVPEEELEKIEEVDEPVSSKAPRKKPKRTKEE
ncbi:MAG: 30S ribosomal protein S2 [Candidatus Omnitrophota bacterium]